MAERLPPQPSPGYVGMLITTCVAMLVGIVVMALEASEYDWDPKPKATAPLALPKAAGATALDGPPAAFAEARPAEEKAPTPLPDAKPAAPPAVAAKPADEPKPAAVPPAATAKTEPAPAGPTPSPLNLSRQKPATPTAQPEEKKPDAPKGDGKPTPSPLRLGR